MAVIKAKVIKAFYYAKDKELYLDEDRFKELEDQGYVVKVKEFKVEKAVKPKTKVEVR